jgi:hypothetical protein
MGRVRIHCPSTDTLSWAKPEHFNGKSGGYANKGAARIAAGLPKA